MSNAVAAAAAAARRAFVYFFHSYRKETLSPNYAPRTAPVVTPLWQGGGRCFRPKNPLHTTSRRAVLFGASGTRVSSATLPTALTDDVVLIFILALQLYGVYACVDGRINYELCTCVVVEKE